MSRSLTFMWRNVLDAVLRGVFVGTGTSDDKGYCWRFYADGAAGPLLIERRYTLTEQVRQLIMLSPAKLWGQPEEIARRLAMGTSTLRRRAVCSANRRVIDRC